MKKIGQNIKTLRVEKGLTQKELADSLHMSYQAVSRWENDDAEPDIDTIMNLADIFGVTLDELFNGKKEQVVVEQKEEVDVVSTPIITATPTSSFVTTDSVIEYRDNILKCDRCGKEFDEDDLGHSFRLVDSNTGESKDELICDECYKKDQTLVDANEKSIKARIKTQSKRRVTKRFILTTVFGALLALAFVLTTIFTYKDWGLAEETPWLTVTVCVLGGYGLFSFIYCVFHDTIIQDIFMDTLEIGFVKFPGIIFELSFDGIMWLIWVKVLFWILGILLAIGAFFLALGISCLISMFVYPFAVIKTLDEE